VGNRRKGRRRAPALALSAGLWVYGQIYSFSAS
jgi:hypothetical protein